MMKLRLADDLTLPAEAATQTFLVVGKRGSGKSTTCVRLAEQLIKAAVPIVAIDPVDRWWGLKASHDGKGPGLSVYVFGGEHADLPLEPGAGAVIADTLVEHRLSAVLSVKHLSGRERGQFVSDLAGRLFQRNKEPLHVFLEEAHEVAPQQPFKGEEEMLGRVTRLWKLGRASGLGGSAITQRPASLSKNITTQAEILIVHRTLGPQDVAAVREWIRYHGERDDILGELATLKTGEAFIWAPDFPEGKPIGLKRVSILDRETFDSSATPKVGQRVVEPKALAPVDLERLRARMAATIEKAKAEDPRELRRRIAELERELRHEKTAVEPAGKLIAAIKEKRVEVPVLKDAQIKRLEALVGRLETVETQVASRHAALASNAEEVRTAATAIAAAVRTKLAQAPAVPPSRYIGPSPVAVARRAEERARSATGTVTLGGSIPPVGQRILSALAELEQLGAREPARELVAFLAGYSHLQSKGFVNAMSALRTEGCIGYPDSGTVALTADGRAQAEPPARPRSPEELQARIIALLGGASGRILAPLIEAYPKPLPRAQVAERAGYGHLQSKGFVNAISRLRTLGFVDYPDSGSIVAKPVLFLEVS